MLVELYPRVHRRYTSLAVIGPILDGYGTWLLKQGYSTDRAREHFRAAPRLVRGLQQRGVRGLTSLTRARLWACAPADSQEDPELAVLVRQMARYCESELSLYPPPALTYAIFLLMATYGLRSCEVVTLTIDDVEWRAGRLRIAQRKTRGSLWLPLTDEVGTALLDYLRHGRAALNVRRQRVSFRGRTPRRYRELFLRCRTPTGVLKPTAVTEAFQAWSKRSGLAIPFQGAHCVRHSYAVHLLRSGLSLKTIGDLLGHRTLESTCVYLRLAVDDLRDVALPLPATADRRAPGVAS